MRCVVKSGVKEYLLVLCTVAIAAAVRGIIRMALPAYPIAGDMFMIVFGGVAAYYIYTRYCAELTYTLGEEGLTVLRRIGRREKRTYVEYSDICGVLETKPAGKQTRCEYFAKSIFRKKGLCYIVTNNGVTVIEAEAEFTDKLKELSNAEYNRCQI